MSSAPAFPTPSWVKRPVARVAAAAGVALAIRLQQADEPPLRPRLMDRLRVPQIDGARRGNGSTMTVLWVWIGIAAVVIAVGLLAARSDRRAKRQGHILRGAGEMSRGLRTSKSTDRIRERTYEVTALPEHDNYSSEDKH